MFHLVIPTLHPHNNLQIYKSFCDSAKQKFRNRVFLIKKHPPGVTLYLKLTA